MEKGAVFLLVFTLVGAASTLSFYGDSISFMSPQKTKDGTYKVTFHHRQNGRSNCHNESSYTCDSSVCTSFIQSSVLQTDQDNTGQGRWCQTEGQTTAIIVANETSFTLRDSGCCWVSNVNGKTKWTAHAELDLGTRSDSHTLNNCPVTTTVSALRVPQNCFSRLRLLTHDADGDIVRCRFTEYATVPSNFTLDETECTLTSTGEVAVGVHLFELLLEDFPSENITLTYADGTSELRQASDTNSSSLCKVKLQFLMDILPPIPNCEAGHVQPMFLSTTPSHGDVLHATVGQKFHLSAQAQAHHVSITDFQVSGPQNMNKVLKNGSSGKAEVTLSWTPQQSDLYRFVPVCFTAEANESQSEMRCVVVMVTQASIIQGKATVICSPNKMEVALEKASMPGIDENFLKLKDPSCSLTSNSTHIMGIMSFSTCGTKLEDKGDFIAFMNEINSFELPSEIIIRRKSVKIDFSCRFPKTISISSYFNVHKSDYIFTESSIGSFGYSFDIFLSNSFKKKVEAKAYPVEIKLLETIYMGIQAQSDLPDLDLFVESCKATPDDNPENSLSYDLIKNGCNQDETLKIYPSNQTSFNFEVQAFKFTGNYDQVYITCSVILCESGSPFSRCAQGCLKDPSRRRRRALSRETAGHYITQGPLQFVGQAAPDATSEDISVMKKIAMPVAVIPPSVAPDIQSAGGRSDEELSDEGLSAGGLSDEGLSAGGLSDGRSAGGLSDGRSAGGLSDGRSAGGRSDEGLSDGLSSSARLKKLLDSNISTVVFASAFFVSLVLLTGVVIYFSRKRKAEDRKSLLGVNWEN